MPFKLETATPHDAPGLAALHAVSERLTRDFGQGPLVEPAVGAGLLSGMKRSAVYVAGSGGRVIATLALSTKKPWVIDQSCFTAVARPLCRTTPWIYYELML